MAITFPRTLPVLPGVRSQRFGADYNNTVHRSPISQKKQTLKRPGTLWGGFYEFAPKRAEDVRIMKAWLLSLEGEANTFFGYDIANRLPSGIADSGSDTPLVKGASQQGSTILTDGWRINQNGLLEVGDYFQIGNTGEAIQLKQTVEVGDSNGIGEVTISFKPPLHNAPADNAPIIFENPVGVFELSNPNNGFETSVDSFTRFAFAFIERPDV